MLAGIEKEITSRKILEDSQTIDLLSGTELRPILKWSHGVVKPEDEKVPEQIEKWKKLIEQGKGATFYWKWPLEEEEALKKLKAKPVSTKKTVLGCLKVHT